MTGCFSRHISIGFLKQPYTVARTKAARASTKECTGPCSPWRGMGRSGSAIRGSGGNLGISERSPGEDWSCGQCRCRFTSKLSFKSFFYSWDIWNTKWYCMVGGSYIVYLYSVCDVLEIITQKKHVWFWSSLRCMDVWYIYIHMFDDVCVKVRTDPKEPTYINSSPLL